MTRNSRRVTSLRVRILGVVVAGAVLPLALVGWWLSRSAETSARRGLTVQLDSSLQRVAASMERRWQFRAAELELLAGNDVVRRMLDGPTANTLTAADSEFMASLESTTRSSIARVTYRDRAGTARWSIGGRSTSEVGSGPRQAEAFAEPSLRRVVPVLSSAGVPIGTADVYVRLSAILPADSIPNVIVGSSLRIRDTVTNQLISAETEPRNSAQPWISAGRTLSKPPIRVELVAPAGAYLEPFHRAAQLGLFALIGVAMLAIALSAYLASRVVRSIERLADAADAVAGGQLAGTVEASGGGNEVERLASAFNAMTESLRSTLEKLSQRESLAAVGEFAASLSHEVRNALTPIRVDLQRANEKLPDSSGRELVGRALTNVKRLDTIVGGALRLARSGQTPLQGVDVNTVIRNALLVVEPAFSGHQLDYVDEPGMSISVRGDAVALEQLLVNLLFNAAQSLGDRGRVVVALSITEGSCEIEVADNGRGISPLELTRLGEPLNTSRAAGTGLGLSIARRIATAHGGDLSFESVTGQGTRARVRLPLPERPGVLV